MNCPNCGRELAEGEVCTCTQDNVQDVKTATLVTEVKANEPIQQPEPTQQIESVQQPEPARQSEPVQQTPQFVPPQGEYFPPNAQEQYQAPQYQAPQYQQAQYQPPQYQQPQPIVKLPARTDYPEGYKIKRKYAAVILAATLGVFGIHNFYLGESNKGVIHILVATLGSLVAGLGFIASYVWAIVEAVQLLTDDIDRDSEGFKIQTFEEALVKTRMEAEKEKDEKK